MSVNVIRYGFFAVKVIELLQKQQPDILLETWTPNIQTPADTPSLCLKTPLFHATECFSIFLR